MINISFMRNNILMFYCTVIGIAKKKIRVYKDPIQGEKLKEHNFYPMIIL